MLSENLLRGEIASVVVVVALLVGVGIGYFGVGKMVPASTVTSTETTTETVVGRTNAPTQTITSSLFQTVSTTVTLVSTTVSTAPASIITSYDCGLNTTVLTVNGSRYCAAEISGDIAIPNPGYGYFLNGSVYFMGVKFATICPPIYSGCPGSSTGGQTVTTVMLGAIKFNMTFPDGNVETGSGVIGDSTYVPVLSKHVGPRAGMLIEIQYGAPVTTDHVFLLVSYFGTSTTSTTCVITGQPGPFFLRVLSDSTQTPVSGAQVTATNQPALCNGTPATGQTTLRFTTNATQWYQLGSENNAGYSFVVVYLGQSYSFGASLAPISVTCATLYVPSGKTNVTMAAFRTSCG